jgi:hypothetical protein
MSWNRNSVRAAVAALLAATAGAAMADTLVVFSRGPSAKLYPPGKSLPEGAAIRLQPNDQLTLLDGRGTRTLRGPGSFNLTRLAAAEPVSDINARLTLLTAAGTDRRIRIGAVRGAPPAEMRSPNLWYVDVARPGTVCIADPAALTMWRPVIDKDQAVVITGAGKAPAKLSWAQGSPTLAWPAALPVATGAEYSLKVGDGAPVKIRFAVLDSRPSGMENTASTLITDGCDSQLDLLVQTFSVPADEASPAG